MKIIYEKKVNFFVIGLLIINLFFCESQKSNNIKSKKKSAISFSDQFGRIINLEKPAEKIIMLTSGVEILIGLDASEKRLKGTYPSAISKFMKGILGQFFPGIAKISTNVGGGKEPNMEEILRINPDLIFQYGLTGYKKNLVKMEELGLNVVAFDWSVEKDITMEYINIMGNAIGRLKKAAKLISWRNDMRKKLKSKVINIPDKDRLRSFYFFSSRKNYTVLESSAMYMLKANYPARVKGEKRDWKEKKVNSEQILEWNPEIILLSPWKKKSFIPKDFYKNALFSDLSAVKNRRIYTMPSTGQEESVGGDGSHEDPLTWMWMAMILYPDYFNFDLRKEIKTWYKMIYEQIPTNEQINKILRIDINRNSKHYKRFM